jgi:hypothetical protein
MQRRYRDLQMGVNALKSKPLSKLLIEEREGWENRILPSNMSEYEMKAIEFENIHIRYSSMLMDFFANRNHIDKDKFSVTEH